MSRVEKLFGVRANSVVSMNEKIMALLHTPSYSSGMFFHALSRTVPGLFKDTGRSFIPDVSCRKIPISGSLSRNKEV